MARCDLRDPQRLFRVLRSRMRDFSAFHRLPAESRRDDVESRPVRKWSADQARRNRIGDRFSARFQLSNGGTALRQVIVCRSRIGPGYRNL